MLEFTLSRLTRYDEGNPIGAILSIAVSYFFKNFLVVFKEENLYLICNMRAICTVDYS